MKTSTRKPARPASALSEARARSKVLEVALQCVALKVLNGGEHASLDVYAPYPIAADMNAPYVVPVLEPELLARQRPAQ